MKLSLYMVSDNDLVLFWGRMLVTSCSPEIAFLAVRFQVLSCEVLNSFWGWGAIPNPTKLPDLSSGRNACVVFGVRLDYHMT